MKVAGVDRRQQLRLYTVLQLWILVPTKESSAGYRHNLPLFLPSLIGRERELHELASLLDADTSVVRLPCRSGPDLQPMHGSHLHSPRERGSRHKALY